MAGEGAVDIDLYATVDEFEPEVTGQVRIIRHFIGKDMFMTRW